MVATKPAALSILVCLLGLQGCVPTPEATKLDPSLTLAPDPRVTEGLARVQSTGQGQKYDLPSLIDIAQRNNPATKAAWLRATEAAEAVNLVKASYLPRLSAQILAGQSHGSNAGIEDPLGILPSGTVATNTKGAAGLLTVQWLVFDFGVRDALQTSTSEIAWGAKVAVSGIHQTLLHDVTQSYYSLAAIEAREVQQQKRLVAAKEIAAMSKARLTQELATVVELAQAEQFVSQAQFDLSRVRSERATVSARLVSLAGLPLGTTISTRGMTAMKFPKIAPAEIDTFVANALERRPDLQAAFARARASRASVDAVEALFRPKIVASASLGRTFLDGSIRDDRVSGILGDLSGQTERNVAGIFLGVSIPLWDGNSAKYRRDTAIAGAEAAEAEAAALRELAQGEIIAAYEALRASLAAISASRDLVATASRTYDSARAMGEQGLLTIAEINAAHKLLYDAEIAKIDAEFSARSAAALLAFATGRIAD